MQPTLRAAAMLSRLTRRTRPTRLGKAARAAALVLAATIGLSFVAVARAQTNQIDVVLPTAPELARPGDMTIGVRRLTVTDRNRVDVLNTKQGAPAARYDRTFTLEAWYPAVMRAGQSPGGDYRVVTRDPSRIATLHGQAVRDASPQLLAGPYPLVIISHGYPGNRFLMSHLAENLASKGYVVVAIDHPESTYDDQKAFASTLYNRPFDQLFVLNEVDRLSKTKDSFFTGLVDASRTGLVGYSMGGYGAVNVIGGGFRDAAVTQLGGPPNRLLAERAASNPAYQSARDPRIKSVIAVAPWGMNAGYWDAAGLAGIRTPTLFLAGSADTVAGYEKGTRAIYEGAVNADRYLLTFLNANHNAGAPIPAPVETYAWSETQKSFPYTHYADAVWDSVVMNNIFQHFATAWFDWHLKGKAEDRSYFDVVPNGKDGVWAMTPQGQPGPTHTYWKGFQRGTAVGLVLEHAAPTNTPAK